VRTSGTSSSSAGRSRTPRRDSDETCEITFDTTDISVGSLGGEASVYDLNDHPLDGDFDGHGLSLPHHRDRLRGTGRRLLLSPPAPGDRRRADAGGPLYEHDVEQVGAVGGRRRTVDEDPVTGAETDRLADDWLPIAPATTRSTSPRTRWARSTSTRPSARGTCCDRRAASASRVVLADPGDINPVVLTVADLAYGWEVANAGQLSCRIGAAALLDAGLANRVGKWIRTEHPTAGAWAGVVTDADLDVEQGVWSLAAEHFTHALLDARTTPRDYSQSTDTAGGLIGRRSWRRAGIRRSSSTDTEIAESGDVLDYQWRGEQLVSLFDALAGSLWEYRIREADRVLEWRDQVGVDRPTSSSSSAGTSSAATTPRASSRSSTSCSRWATTA
jgi:hypothetical protein